MFKFRVQICMKQHRIPSSLLDVARCFGNQEAQRRYACVQNTSLQESEKDEKERSSSDGLPASQMLGSSADLLCCIRGQVDSRRCKSGAARAFQKLFHNRQTQTV